MNPEVGLYGALLEASASRAAPDSHYARARAPGPAPTQCRCASPRSNACSSASVLMLLNASGLSSNSTSTTFSAASTTRRSCARRLREMPSGPAARSCGRGRTPGAAGRRSSRRRGRRRSLSQRRVQPRDQIVRQERRIARHGRDEIVRRFASSPRCSPASGPGVAADLVGDHAVAERARRSSRFWLALMRTSSTCGAKRSITHCTIGLPRRSLQALVDAAHAAALAAGQDDAGDG